MEPVWDTIDRIVTSHFAAVTRRPFTYKERTYSPQPLAVSPLLFREFHCPAECGACCRKVTLDYLPSEELPDGTWTLREIEIDGRVVEVVSDMQADNQGRYCHHLVRDTGRCDTHGRHPFECDFAYVAFQVGQTRPNRLTQRLPGRHWNLLRVDGQRGARCHFTPPTEYSVGEVVRKLKRLRMWVDHFGLDTVVDEIIAWALAGPHSEPLYLNQEFASERRISLFPA